MGYEQVWLSYNQLFIPFFFLFLFKASTCLHAQLCTQEQSSALLQLKGTFSFNKSASLYYCDYNGITSFPKMESWKKGSDCCSWAGVDCDGTGRVIGLDLSCSWLQGTIHPNSSLFLSFPHLQKLNLAYNNFSMSRISPEFTRFTELTHLNLSECGFSGKVPPGVSFLNKLVSLDLSYNFDLRLEEGGFELLIQNLSKLRDLDLSEVNISSSVFPNSLLNLTSLRTLSLGGSGLHGEVPPGVSYLNKLVSLDLSENFDLRLEEGGFELLIQNLSKLRDLSLIGVNMSSSVVSNSLLNLTFLRSLGLGKSGLHGEFPSGVFHLPHLQILVILFEEGLTGHIPDFINSTYPLQNLILIVSGISGILPDSIANLKSLKQLVIYHSEFHGSIPTSLWNFPQITSVDLSSNNFSGILPSSISNLTQITSLDLSYNNFHGTLPSSISNLTQITYLDLSSNNFSGSLPFSISNLGNLKTLRLSDNNFTGRFFSWDANLPELHSLDVANNSLTSPLPSQVVVPPNLSYLIIGRNSINGTIPSWVFELPALNYLDLSYNKLIGHTLEFQSPSLEIIDLSYNDLNGTVPNSTFELRNLTHLILSSNSFSGTIPRSNRFSENLNILALKMNNFSGTIHDSFTRRNSLTTINLYGNGFEGPIPKSLINCRILKVLDLGRNNFYEEFPHWLGNLPNLHVLILQSNKFHGSIVTSTTKFPFPALRVLDMSNNRFTGPLPIKYFKSFKAMMNVDEENYHLKYMESNYGDLQTYFDSLTMVIKGSTIEMEQILTIFTAIDLSRNKFQGEIPEIIGGLNSIRGLNLSHNSLTGHIPKLLANMTKLEWLDLSSNELTGEIPQQLTNLISLGTLNLSQNRLTGPIPRGKQFDTFSNDSYFNNSALCGPPLSNTCGDPKATQPPPLTFEEEDSEHVSGFGWEVILPGYGFGLVVGLVMGYLMFSFGKPQWLVKMVESVGNRNGKRLKSNARRRGGRRN
ncbi:receptor-like protein 6 [Rhododendron vialii]|uniref:receptor-like protein 6 n=1 Tax=Rhododendron vialii TaxID=182163 RepID=UPI00265D664D|nr:receptor-like protein 6 [Rhododendron vialii]